MKLTVKIKMIYNIGVRTYGLPKYNPIQYNNVVIRQYDTYAIIGDISEQCNI